ncbi:MAG: hypothetical protein AAGD38_22870, partial [Acidobacteriota bacterium]
AIAPSSPSVVYALVEAETSALVRSDDGGTTWTTMNDGSRIAPRPFYYADLRVDSERPHRVYNLWSLVEVSDDGGKSFTPLVTWPPIHPDHHAMWIDPNDGERILLGNDGGVATSRDRGATWHFVANLPLAQYYHVAVDMDVPYNIYGGLQDNGSWRGPNTAWGSSGIRNHEWQMVAFGDGFDTRPHPENSRMGYAMAQEGYLVRWDLDAGSQVSIRPDPPVGADGRFEDLRFNWSAGLALDPFENDTIYYGSQYLHRSTDRGDTWEIISPDLTTDNEERQKQAESGGLTPDVTGAENYTSIVAVVPSPVRAGVLWVGTDDGRLWRTEDGGANWTSLESRVPEVPEGTWIPHIAASSHDADTAFVVFDDHRRGNLEPYVVRTTDGGKTFERIVSADDVDGYVLVVVQDPVAAELLFLGTEFGLYYSLDSGTTWSRWTHGVPTTSVMDLAIHPRDGDLVVATHGRSLFVIDDLTPLRAVASGAYQPTAPIPAPVDTAEAKDEASASTAASAVALELFTPPVAHQFFQSIIVRGELAPGHGSFSGTNEPVGALMSVAVTGSDLPVSAAAISDDSIEATVEIFDTEGQRIRHFTTPIHQGLNRIGWDLRADAFATLPREPAWWYGEPKGPLVPPGRYEARISMGDTETRAPIDVVLDPRRETPPATEIAAKWEAIRRAGGLQEVVTVALERIAGVRRDVALVSEVLDQRDKERLRRDPEAEDPDADLRDAATMLTEALDELDASLRVPPQPKGIPAENKPLSYVNFAFDRLTESWRAPRPADLVALRHAEQKLETVLPAINRVLGEEVAAFREQVVAASIGLLEPAPPLDLP